MRITLPVLILALFSFSELFAAAGPTGRVVGWGDNVAGQATGIPDPQSISSTGLVTIAGEVLNDITTVSAGRGHSLALKADGTVMEWGGTSSGDGRVRIEGQLLTNVTAISAGVGFNLAVKQDGNLVGWSGGGLPSSHAAAGPPVGLTGIVAVAAGWSHSVALKKDGTVVGWGDQRAPSGLSNVAAIAVGGGGFAPNLALRRDASVGEWSTGELERVPPMATNVVAVAAGAGHSLVLRNDGTVVGWGSNRFGEATGLPTSEFPNSSSAVVMIGGSILSNVTAIAAGNQFSLALKRDGTLVAWGYNGFHVADVPAGLTGVIAIAAGENFCLALTTNNTSLKFAH